MTEFSLRRLTAQDTWEHIATYLTLTETTNRLRTRHEMESFRPDLWLVLERDDTGWVRSYRITHDWDVYEVPVGGLLAPSRAGDATHVDR